MEYLLKERALSEETIRGFRLGADEAGNIVIPYLTVEGKPRYIRKRIVEGDKRYVGPSGESPIVYNVQAIYQSSIIHVTEGEFDCMSLAQVGAAAIGLPGASSVNNVTRILLQGANGVVVWSDPDQAGDNMFESMQELSLHCPVMRVALDLDVNDTLATFGDEYLRSMVAEHTERVNHGL